MVDGVTAANDLGLTTAVNEAGFQLDKLGFEGSVVGVIEDGVRFVDRGQPKRSKDVALGSLDLRRQLRPFRNGDSLPETSATAAMPKNAIISVLRR